MAYLTGDSIRALREGAGLTQRNLADRLGVTDKAVSKWETGRGLPDITLVEPLAAALGVSVAELLSGEQVVNANRAGNLLRAKFYVCPLCGNVIHATGEASISCCGIALPALEAEEDEAATAAHLPQVDIADGEVYLALAHPMEKGHFASFLAYVTTDQVFFRKLYPEQTADARFPYRGPGTIFAYCNRHGLFACRTPRVQRKSIVRLP